MISNSNFLFKNLHWFLPETPAILEVWWHTLELSKRFESILLQASASMCIQNAEIKVLRFHRFGRPGSIHIKAHWSMLDGFSSLYSCLLVLADISLWRNACYFPLKWRISTVTFTIATQATVVAQWKSPGNFCTTIAPNFHPKSWVCPKLHCLWLVGPKTIIKNKYNRCVDSVKLWC